MATKQGLRKTVIECSCFIEGVQLVKFEDDEELYLSMWADKNYAHPITWRQRLRYIWRVLRKGDPFEDQLVLSQAGVQQLVRFLLNAPDDATVYWNSHHSGTQWTWSHSSSIGDRDADG